MPQTEGTLWQRLAASNQYVIERRALGVKEKTATDRGRTCWSSSSSSSMPQVELSEPDVPMLPGVSAHTSKYVFKTHGHGARLQNDHARTALMA